MLDKTYALWLSNLKEKIRSSQLKAALNVNTEMLALYWEIGRELTRKQVESNWGDQIVTRLAKDLAREFPEVRGFSATNLKYIRKWFLFYSAIGQQPVGQLKNKEAKSRKTKILQVVSHSGQQAFGPFPVLLGKVPWGHHINIITKKAASHMEGVFYVQQTAIYKWSRAVLMQQIACGLYQRAGAAITNFKDTLPKTQSELARETLKNPYILDFLGLGGQVQERQLEKSLIQHMKKFLLELGRGFAYVGNQFNLVVENDDFYLDLLFYNYKLHCFVLFELKVEAFKPEFAGKLNFYINTINEQMKGPGHLSSIGVLLCKTPNKTVVEYSLKGIGNARTGKRNTGV